MEKFEIADILRRAFGLSGITFFRPPTPTKNEDGSTFLSDTPERFTSSETGAFGKAILGPTYLSLDNTSVMLDGICTFSMEKNIVKTALAGRNGTVKEYVSAGDYAISIQALLVAESKYQKPDVSALRSILEASQSIKVAGPAWKAFEVYSIVVESFRFAEVGGSLNMLPVEIQCVSDTPVELEFLDK